ncbi:unnamed protein product [Colias eurytheme]|nr:unnamed protein product [Colias eurytheme]
MDFNSDLASIPWNDICHMPNVNDMVTVFNSYVMSLFNKHAAKTTISLKNRRSPWLTSNLRHLMSVRNDALDKYRKTKCEKDRVYYKSLKSFVNICLHQEKISFYDSHINAHSKNGKVLWKNLKNQVLPNFKTSAVLPDHLRDPNTINSHFLNIPGTGNVDKSILDYFSNNSYGKGVFKFDLVDENAIAKIIINLKSNAEGYDGIPRDMILLTLPTTLKVITAIINRSLATSTFPSIWKIALVRPLPKTDNPEDFKDLRPISILPFLSKILEKVVYFQVVKYCEKHNIFPELQSGFRRQRGTTTALLNVTDDLLANQDEGYATALVLLDFSRAFDCLNLQLMVAKLSFYGFDNSSLEWFHSYLGGRSQKVIVSNNDGSTSTSSELFVTRGVPQGSILGPLLFIIYAADITNCINFCKYHIYADDLQVYLPVNCKDLSSSLNKISQDLSAVSKWSYNNSLVLNPNKSKYMIVGSRRQVQAIENSNISLYIENFPIHKLNL